MLMSDFKNLIERLEKYSATINAAIVGTAIVEAVFVILIGIASNNIFNDDHTVNSIATGLLLLFGLLYLFLLLIRTMYVKNYPGSITNELKAERELSILKRNSERQGTIYNFLVITIARLNEGTCALNYGDDTHLCDSGMQEGIHNLIEPIVNNVAFVLDTINTNYTIGIYLSSYASMTTEDGWDSGIIVIEDKLNKAPILAKELITMANVRGAQFHVQTAIKRSLNHAEFVKSDYLDGQVNYSVICSPIPLACDENDMNGVLFIISNRVEVVSQDTEISLKIFNRVISNWVYRYNECTNKRRAALQDREEEPVVVFPNARHNE